MGRRRSAEDFNDNSAGDSVDKLCWGISMNSAGDRKNSGECDLLWLLAEDNPVISLCEE